MTDRDHTWAERQAERQTERQAEREEAERQAEREEEAGSLLSRETDVGLDPRTWEHDLSRRQRL